MMTQLPAEKKGQRGGNIRNEFTPFTSFAQKEGRVLFPSRKATKMRELPHTKSSQILSCYERITVNLF